LDQIPALWNRIFIFDCHGMGNTFRGRGSKEMLKKSGKSVKVKTRWGRSRLRESSGHGRKKLSRSWLQGL